MFVILDMSVTVDQFNASFINKIIIYLKNILEKPWTA